MVHDIEVMQIFEEPTQFQRQSRRPGRRGSAPAATVLPAKGATLVTMIVAHDDLNGETIHSDGVLRMAPH